MKTSGVGLQRGNVISARSESKVFAPLMTIGALLALAGGGCGRNEVPPRIADRSFTPPLPVVSSDHLQSLVRRGERPILVEFGVNFGCSRCDRMRAEMTRMAHAFEGRADVVRMDFTAHQLLAAQFGATICPSYVLFDQGSVVTSRSFPVSADLLAADLASVLTDDDDGEEAAK